MIVEDQFIVAEHIRRNLAKLGYESLSIAKSGEEAIEIIKQDPPDLILIDIQLGTGIDGIMTASAIRQTINVPLIYVTAFSDLRTFNRAKKTEPQAYIVKPFNFSNLHMAIELALFNFSINKPGYPGELDSVAVPKALSTQYVFKDSVFIKVGKQFQKVMFSDICFIKAEGSYSLLNAAGRAFTMSMNLHTLLKKLNRQEFMRVHRSYVVNLNNSERVEEFGLRVKEILIPISRKVRQELLQKFHSI